MLKQKTMETMFDEGISLADYLPYGEYIDGYFLHVDGSVGQIWELETLETEGMDEARLLEAAHMISGVVSRIPSGMAAQLLIWSDPDIHGLLSRYTRSENLQGADVVRLVIDGKVNDMLAGAGERFKHLRLYLTLRHFPDWPSESKPDLVHGYFSGRDNLDGAWVKSWNAVQMHFSRACAALENQLQAVPIAYERLNEKAFLQLLYRWLNPSRAGMMREAFLRPALIRDQVLFHAPRVSEKGLELEEYLIRVVTLKELPSSTFPGMFSGELLDISPGMLVAFNFVVPDQQKALEQVKFQKSFAFLQRTSSMGDASEEAVHQKEELSRLITETFKSGKVIVSVRMHVVFWGKDFDALERASDALLSRFHRVGADGLKEEIISPSLFLSVLPLNFDPRFEHIVRRSRRLLSDNFADMLPFYGAFSGTRTPAVLYSNRRGVPVALDFFDSPTNPHGMIIGASGAGKSFLTNDFIYQNYRLGAYFFVLDKGHSYRKTCAILDGQYVQFDIKSPVTINPFSVPMNEENAAFLLDVLSLMASGGDERDRVTREEKGILQMALGEAYSSVTKREVVLSDVVSVLEGMGRNNLALRLLPFTRQGPYGKFFDGKNQFEIGRRFTVFELADLAAYPELQLVVLLNIMFAVTQFVASAPMLPLRKFLLIDEAWQLLKMANTADFIANAFKTFRKCRCSTVAITQEVGDLIQHKSGAAIMANTANKIFLKQEVSVIEELQKEMCLSLKVAENLRSIQMVKGKFAEAYILTPSSSGVVRLMPDPFLYWAATSDAKDNAFLEDAKASCGGNLVEALKICAKDHPQGVR